MPAQSTRQATPLSLTSNTDDLEPAVKRPRKRKSTEKKAVPRSSTLHGLWGIKPPETAQPCVEEANGECAGEENGEMAGDCAEATGKLVFKITPEKLSAVVNGVENGQRMITPPRSLPDTAVSETPKQNADGPTTPNSSEKGKGKRSYQPPSPTEDIRRSPRNHQSSFDATAFPPLDPGPVAIAPKPAPPAVKPKIPHPFFLGKEARQALQATVAPTMHTTLSDTDEPSLKRRKSVSSDQSAFETSSLLPAKPIRSAKPFHPFFMSRTASLESTASAPSMPLLPLPQGKTVYLGNGKPAPFPSRGMNHIHDNLPRAQTERQTTLKQKKGKATHHNYHGLYSSLISIYKSIDFIPPEKVIYSKSHVQQLAKDLLGPNCHRALLRAYKILCNESRTLDPDGIAWTHKFRARRADEILSGNNAGFQLRNWVAGDRKQISSSIPAEMDDFIVDDDLEDDDLEDDSEDSISEVDTPRKPKRKKVFSAYENVVILVGGHGVGKSCAVYAVAEEMGYQVFEISPGMKRGGREIVEAVGEVGQSELVTKHRTMNTVDISPVKEAGEKKGRKGLVCFEEVDVLYEEDKSFWSGVTNLVEKSRRPVILTCNDMSGIPQNFINCRTIEFTPEDEGVVRDFLRIITLSQGHIIEPAILERYYLESKKDLRKTLSTVQFWCQFGVGDTRGGTEWLNWNGKEDDWIMSKDTLTESVNWRQEIAAGPEVVLETTQDISPDLDLEDLVFPQQFHDLLTGSPTSMFKRHRSTYAALTGLERVLDTMSFMDCTVDQQFTAYEIDSIHNVSSDDVQADLMLRYHPGQRFEEPQGGEFRWSPSIRVLARKVLEEKLRDGGYTIPPLSHEKITSQPLKDLLHPRDYLSKDDFYDPLDELLYETHLDEKYQPTQGLLHSLSTISTDIAPIIRNILHHEQRRRKFPPDQISLDLLWTNTRVTRNQTKAAQEGKRKYFGEKVDEQAVLKTWIYTEDCIA